MQNIESTKLQRVTLSLGCSYFVTEIRQSPQAISWFLTAAAADPQYP